MDKLFDYLVIGFLIFSVLASLFKKKTPPPEQEEEVPVPSGPDDEMLLWEQENFPSHQNKPEVETAQKQTAIKPTFNVEYNTKYIDAVKENKLAEEVKESEEKIDEKAEKFLSSQVSYQQEDLANKTALSIRNKIGYKDYLKEAFIISEILNKPIGLRIDG